MPTVLFHNINFLHDYLVVCEISTVRTPPPPPPRFKQTASQGSSLKMNTHFKTNDESSYADSDNILDWHVVVIDSIFKTGS